MIVIQKRTRIILIALAVLLSSSVSVAVVVRFTRHSGHVWTAINPSTGCNGGACCASGEVCTYRDSADSLYKLHKADNSVVELGGAASTGNWTFTGNNASISGTSTDITVDGWSILGIDTAFGDGHFGKNGAGILSVTATSTVIASPSAARLVTVNDTNTTITGPAECRYSALGAVSTTGVLMSNTTAATSGAQEQRSPGLEFNGTGWNGSASQTNKMRLELRPAGLGGSIENRLAIMGNFAGGALTDALYIDHVNGTVYLTQYTNRAYGITFGSSLSFTSPSSIHRMDSIWPNTDGQTLGQSSVPLGWTINSLASYGRLQTPSFSATMNINPALGEHIKVTLTGNLTNWTISAPPGSGPGNTRQLVVIEFVQDGTGSRLIGTPPASIKWLPSTYRGTDHSAPTLTTTAGAKDYFYFISDNDAGTYVQVGENLNN